MEHAAIGDTPMDTPIWMASSLASRHGNGAGPMFVNLSRRPDRDARCVEANQGSVTCRVDRSVPTSLA